MTLVAVTTSQGRRLVNVCDQCKAACVDRRERFCSGRCAREWHRQRRLKDLPSGAGATAAKAAPAL